MLEPWPKPLSNDNGLTQVCLLAVFAERLKWKNVASEAGKPIQQPGAPESPEQGSVSMSALLCFRGEGGYSKSARRVWRHKVKKENTVIAVLFCDGNNNKEIMILTTSTAR